MSQRFGWAWKWGRAAALTLLALQAGPHCARADLPELTVASVTSTGPGTIVVTGTVVPCNPQGDVGLQGNICQYEGRFHHYTCSFGSGGADKSTSPYTYAITFINPTGYKNSPATLTLSACCFDPNTFQILCTTVSQELHPH